MPSVASLPVLLTASLIMSTSATIAEVRTYFTPNVDGQPIAFCVQSSTDCGKPVADAWCRSQGFDEALLFQRDVAAKAVALHVDTGRPCSEELCLSFHQIKCWTS